MKILWIEKLHSGPWKLGVRCLLTTSEPWGTWSEILGKRGIALTRVCDRGGGVVILAKVGGMTRVTEYPGMDWSGYSVVIQYEHDNSALD